MPITYAGKYLKCLFIRKNMLKGYHLAEKEKLGFPYLITPEGFFLVDMKICSVRLII